MQKFLKESLGYIEAVKEALILDKDYKNYACLFSKEGEL